VHPSSAQSDFAEVQGAPERAAGSGRIEAALAGLETLGERPLSEHAEVYEQVHTRLQAALSEIDSD
jgi:hypothetical protein